jgi:hypothetical protein
MGSLHMKANKGWEEGCKGIVKKAFLRSRIEKKEVWGGILRSRIEKKRGLGRNLGEKRIWVRNHRMSRVNSSIDFSEVLD